MPSKVDELSLRIIRLYFEKWSATSRALYERPRCEATLPATTSFVTGPVVSRDAADRAVERRVRTKVSRRESADNFGGRSQDHRDVVLEYLGTTCLKASQERDARILDHYRDKSTPKEDRRKKAQEILTVWYLENFSALTQSRRSFSCGHPLKDLLRASAWQRIGALSMRGISGTLGHRLSHFIELLRFDSHYLYVLEFANLLVEAIPVRVDPVPLEERHAFVKGLETVWQLAHEDVKMRKSRKGRSEKRGSQANVQWLYMDLLGKLKRGLRRIVENEKPTSRDFHHEGPMDSKHSLADSMEDETNTATMHAMVEEEWVIPDPEIREVLEKLGLSEVAFPGHWRTAFERVRETATSTELVISKEHGMQNIPRTDKRELKKWTAVKKHRPLDVLAAYVLLIMEGETIKDRKLETMAKCATAHLLSIGYDYIGRLLQSTDATYDMIDRTYDHRNWTIIQNRLDAMLAHPPPLVERIAEKKTRAHGLAAVFSRSYITQIEGITDRDLVTLFRR